MVMTSVFRRYVVVPKILPAAMATVKKIEKTVPKVGFSKKVYQNDFHE